MCTEKDNQRAHPSSCPEFLSALRLVGMADSPRGWSSSPAPFEIELMAGDPKTQLKSHCETIWCGQPLPLITVLDYSVWCKAHRQRYSYQARYSKDLEMTFQEPRAKARPLFRLRLMSLLHRMINGKVKVAVHSRSEWEIYLGWQVHALIFRPFRMSEIFHKFNENIINGLLC